MKLSKEASDLLEENSYKLKQSGESLIISRWSLDRVVLYGFLLVFLLAVGVIASLLHIGLSIIAWLFIVMIAIWQFEKIRSRIKFSIDKYTRHIQIEDVRLQPKGIHSLDITSTFVGSYTSAFKDTNEEHNIGICLTTENGDSYEVISFKSDYAEPCKAIKEIGSLIKSELSELTTVA